MSFLPQALLLVALAAAGAALLYGIYWAVSRDATRDKSRDLGEVASEALGKGADGAMARGCTVGRVMALAAVAFIVLAAAATCSR